jgi:hypothetical protein
LRRAKSIQTLTPEASLHPQSVALDSRGREVGLTTAEPERGDAIDERVDRMPLGDELLTRRAPA